MPNLDRAKKKVVWIPNSGGRFLITVMNCLQQCVHNEFEVVPPCRKPGFFMILTGIEGSNLCACPGSHAFVCYPAVRRKKLANTLYMEQGIISLQSVFVGHKYLQYRAWSGAGLTD